MIIESANYKNLTADELFSKLKSTKIDHQTRSKIENPSAPIVALVLRGGPSLANLSPTLFALASLLSISEERIECLGDDELSISKWMHSLLSFLSTFYWLLHQDS